MRHRKRYAEGGEQLVIGDRVARAGVVAGAHEEREERRWGVVERETKGDA